MNFRRLLFRKRQAYQAFFNENDRDAQVILADLREFCHADTPCWDEDARIHAAREGRREVWLRIKSHLNLSDEDIDNMTQVETGDY